MRATTCLGLTVGTLAVANVLGHRIAPRAAPATAAGTVAALALIARAGDLSSDELGMDHRNLPSGLRWGGSAAVLVAAGYGTALSVPAVRGVVAGSGATRSQAIGRALGSIPLTTVLPEEFAFRGVLHGLLARRFGGRRAVLASSVVFGLWHVLPALGGGPVNESVDRVVGHGPPAVAVRVVGTVLLTTVGGLLMAGVRLRSGSLLAPILLHWAVNGLGELISRRAPSPR